MENIADLLTTFRALCGPAILIVAYFFELQDAVVVFILGGLSDVFDGPAARLWPNTNAKSIIRWVSDPEGWDSLADCIWLYCAMLAISLYDISMLHNWTVPIILIILLGVGVPVLKYHNKYKGSKIQHERVLSVRLNGWLGVCYFVQSFFVLAVYTYRGFEQWFMLLCGVYIIVAALIIYFKRKKVERLWHTELPE